MKAVVYHGQENLVLEQKMKPEPKPGEVLIETKYVGICGSDLGIYYGNYKKIDPPLIIGHEGGGVVRKLGDGVSQPKLGDRVAVSPIDYCGRCSYCKQARYSLCDNLKEIGMIEDEGEYAEYFVAPAQNCHRLPKEITYKEAALIDTLAGPVSTVKRMDFPIDSKTAIYGAGPAGLFFSKLSKLLGAEVVYLMGRHDYRLELGPKYGADVTVNVRNEDPVKKIMSMTHGRGVHKVIEAAGSEEASDQAFRSLAKGGTMAAYGVVETGPVSISLEDLVLNEYTLFGIADNTHGYPGAIDFIANGKIDVKPMITHEFELDELPEAFSQNIMRDKKEGYLKGVVLL